MSAVNWLLVVGHVVLGEDRLDRALGDAQRAVDALVGIDDEEIGTLAKAVDRADVDAVGVLAADAALGDDVGHGGGSRAAGSYNRLNFSKSDPIVCGRKRGGARLR